ncbi:hypothetical protein [Nocardia transvalensis]|uniref:hypothetical protein n=1 Tax=Nocardia transvalensis TaxID=37333 RepID=UPI001E5098D9|nr:hypothetical protein [Nocardia transvalensis]
MTAAGTTAPALRIRRAAAGVLGAAVLAAGGCGGGGDRGAAQPDPARPPTGVRWQSYQGVALPVTDQGPAHDSDGAATGFDRGPAGAAVAAITHSVRLAVAADSQWPTVIAEEVVPGPARDEWAVNRLQLSITGPAADQYAPRVLGYHITSYSQDRSTVDVFTPILRWLTRGEPHHRRVVRGGLEVTAAGSGRHRPPGRLDRPVTQRHRDIGGTGMSERTRGTALFGLVASASPVHPLVAPGGVVP